MLRSGSALAVFTLTTLSLLLFLVSVSANPLSVDYLSPRKRDEPSSSASGTSTSSASSSSGTVSSGGSRTDNRNSGGNGTSDDGTKYVFAHFMVGNTYPYTVDDWADDMSLAGKAGIDAFAINIGPDSWQADQVKNAYQAAEQSNFKLFMSFTVIPH